MASSMNDGEEIDVIICMVCFEGFSSSRHAYSAKCGHLICKECLNQLAKDRMRPLVRCPYCRKDVLENDFFRINLCSAKIVTIDERKVVLNNVRLMKRDTAKGLAVLDELISKERSNVKWIPSMASKSNVKKSSETLVENIAINQRVESLEHVKTRMEMTCDGIDRVVQKLSSLSL